jgi:hypothetical protein
MPDFRLRFVTDDSFISRGIRFVEGGSSVFSHVEIILPDGSYLGAHNPEGVEIRPADYCTPTRERRYAIPVEQADLDKMLAFAHAQVGKRYDLSDIRGIMFHRNWHDPTKWICSELVAAIAEAGGLWMLNVLPEHTNAITPEMLHLSPVLINHCYFHTPLVKR